MLGGTQHGICKGFRLSFHSKASCPLKRLPRRFDWRIKCVSPKRRFPAPWH